MDSHQIHIHLDKIQYFPGETVTGCVQVFLQQPLELESLGLKISGEEKLKYKYFDGKHWRTAKNDKSCLEIRLLLLNQKQVLQPGGYNFPFQAVLPLGLPGTLALNLPDNLGFASVQYEIRADVAIPGFFNSDLKHYRPLFVCEPLKQQITPAQMHKENKVTFCCCVPKGTVAITASVDRNSARPGEEVNIRVIVDNGKSQVDLPKWAVSIDRQIHLKGGWLSNDFLAAYAVAEAIGGTIAKGQTVDEVCTLRLPDNVEPSTHGGIIEIVYKLHVELHVPWSPNVHLHQDLDIYIPLLDPPSPLMVVPGVEPVQMPLQTPDRMPSPVAQEKQQQSPQQQMPPPPTFKN